MERRAGLVVAGVISLTLVACGPDAAHEATARDLLFMRTTGGVALVETGASAPRFESASAEPAPDWRTVVKRDLEDSQTKLTAADPATGDTLWTRSLPGKLSVKVVSPGARFVALAPGGRRYYSRPGHSRFTITGQNMSQARTIDLQGNFEPEAFSTDGRSLFVVQYLPAANPTHYQVRRLDLRSGKVRDVFSVDKELQESMRGTARVQEMSPDGKRLYTLYTVNTPHGAHSFIHVLSLDELWAHCIDLPDDFAMGGDKKTALGVSPDGERVYVADAYEGALAEVDTERLRVVRTAPLDLTSAWAATDLITSPDGTSLFVASGRRVVAASTADLTETSAWEMDDKVTGMQVGSDGNLLYVGLPGEVAVVDRAKGQVVRTLDPPGLGPIEQLGPVTRGLDPARTEIVCGC
ncbi:MAG: hypothetical protein M3N53_09950 [Actinomycetota bacterium]|nr:hypothetical protein [Actinomycetota bacterium]